ncbi:hypothetical protein D3C87_686610 [compost metagenome]
MQNYVSPSGKAIVGTFEKLEAAAIISGINADGTPVYEGSTEVYWDTAVTATDEDGNILFIDEEGDTWIFDQLLPASE